MQADDTPDALDTMDGHDRPDTPASHDRPDTSGVSDASTLSIQEAAAELGISERQVRRYLKAHRLRADRVRGPHGLQVRISRASVEDLRGQREALEQGATDTEDTYDSADRPDVSGGAGVATPSVPAVRAADVQALVEAISDRLDEQYRARLADKDALIEELRRRAEAAETRLAATERAARPRRPLWLRLILGR